MRLLLLVVLAATTTGLAHAGEKEQENQPIKVISLDRKNPVTYEKEIEPILVNKCNACHSGHVKKGRFDMGTYESVMKGGKKGKVVIPGRSANSRLVQLAGKTMKPFMPPTGDGEPLTPE